MHIVVSGEVAQQVEYYIKSFIGIRWIRRQSQLLVLVYDVGVASSNLVFVTTNPSLLWWIFLLYWIDLLNFYNLVDKQKVKLKTWCLWIQSIQNSYLWRKLRHKLTGLSLSSLVSQCSYWSPSYWLLPVW